ncbi:tonB-system energizer ExbB [Rhodocista pekingensis]|uniref:Biopolymer transport protein ExbB n=1 Tax=Rhodocista pekingensis TaxID=201185 RepID=A0ABW2L0G7_9PROT
MRLLPSAVHRFIGGTLVTLLAAGAALAQEVPADGGGGGAAGQALDMTMAAHLTPWGMFMQADWVVKTVMIGLLLASVATWTVLIAKSVELRRARAVQRAGFDSVDSAQSLAQAIQAGSREDGVLAEMTAAASLELRLSADALQDVDGVKERVALRLQRIEATAGRRIAVGTGLLATIGATSPFIGLFGTVWGIMNAFIGIADSKATNLAVVAPGIAEALLATAFGLIAAIPAVVIYNHFTRQIAAYRGLVADTGAAVMRIVSRDLSRGMVGRADLRLVAE